MESLKEFQFNLLENIKGDFFRFLYYEIPWSQRMIAIKGLRGAGKTTLILQRLKFHKESQDVSLYASADHPFFYTHTLLELADLWYKNGGRILYIDEVHKYPNWSRELKNIYDGYPKLKIVFTASSALDIYRGESDLSRRVLTYHLPGLSLKEYAELVYGLKTPAFSLDEVLHDHIEITRKTAKLIESPLKLFRQYLISGYLPFTAENKESEYLTRLYQVIDASISGDLAFIKDYSATHAAKIKKLLGVIAESAPFEPNITSLAQKLGLGRDTVNMFLQHLQSAHLLNLINRPSAGVAALQKPDKIYLENTNLSYALKPAPETGTLRETFLLNQLKNTGHSVEYPPKGDFLIDRKYTIEVGGQNKQTKQIADIGNSYIAADEILTGFANKIPLWLFGFLY